MMLEELYDHNTTGSYSFSFDKEEINIFPMLEAILKEKDLQNAVSRFFHTLVEIIKTLHEAYDLPLVLSGGVFQNRILTALVLKQIPDAIISTSVPPNDGGIALGQVAHQLGAAHD